MKNCLTCGKEISDKNKSGYCKKHLDVSGEKNPFYGKTFSEETLNRIKQKTREASIKKWQDPVYRDKNIKSTSKPRKPSFSIEQKIRIKKWYQDNPEQRDIRSVQMKNSWETGKIVHNVTRYNTSKSEKELFEIVKNMCLDCVMKKALKYENKIIIPDILIPEIHLVIEFYGDYWHANPDCYEADTIIKNQRADEIWKRDENRLKILSFLGFDTIVVWQSEFKFDREEVIKKIYNVLNVYDWDSCCL